MVTSIKPSQKVTDIIILIGVGLVIYSLYKVSQTVSDVVNAVPKVAEGAKDVIIGGGSGTKALDEKTEDAKKYSAWSPDWLKKNIKQGTKLFTVAALKIIAKKINKEFSPDIGNEYVFAPHISRLWDYLKTVQYKSQLSQLADYYEKQYGVPMLQQIQTGLKAAGWTNAEYLLKMQSVIDFAEKLK